MPDLKLKLKQKASLGSNHLCTGLSTLSAALTLVELPFNIFFRPSAFGGLIEATRYPTCVYGIDTLKLCRQ
jgi:hypothetical protein